ILSLKVSTMLSPRYDPSGIEGTPEPTLPNPPGALLRLPSFRSFFSLFTPFLPSNITVLNTPFTRSAISSSSTLMPSRRIC
ncbi:uncharacterized protein K441DRAFT_659127, partial [Cenococcum geophilum 1.58]|uniref:uncharacterized protein n=1 Tax=Cenococcum geophilum 1.58 TaxID=794803 RepID=UPI00358E279B